MTAPNLPEPIAAYFDADKRGDPAAVARCFTEEAVVRDEGQQHTGRAAIREWKTAASAKYSYTSQPLALEQTDEGYVVTSRLTGDFPGSPVELRYAFRLERGKIASLEITA
jgi:ketosteroid isomerase-like protein